MFIHCSEENMQTATWARSARIVEQSGVLFGSIKTNVLALVEGGDGGTKNAGNSLRVKYE